MEQNLLKIRKNKKGVTLLGIDIPKGISPNDYFDTTPSYAKHIYKCSPRVISIPPQLEYEGELLDVIEISGHPFEECDLLEELIIPQTVRRIHWNGWGRSKLSRITVHNDNPVFQDIDGVLYTRKGFDRDGKKKDDWIELIAYPSAKGSDYSVPHGVTRLANQSFKYTSISHLDLPNTLKEIGTNVFYGCRFLTEVVVPSSVIKNEGSTNCYVEFKNEK